MGRSLTEPEPPVVAAAVNDRADEGAGRRRRRPPSAPTFSGRKVRPPADAAAGRVRMLIFGGREPLPFCA